MNGIWFLVAMAMAAAGGYVLRWGHEELRAFRRDLKEDRDREPGHIGVLDDDTDVSRIKAAFIELTKADAETVQAEIVADASDATQILPVIRAEVVAQGPPEHPYTGRHRSGARRLVHQSTGTAEHPLVPVGGGFSVSRRRGQRTAPPGTATAVRPAVPHLDCT